MKRHSVAGASRFLLPALLACLSGAAQPGSISGLVDSVRVDLRANHTDGQIAKDVRKIKLTQRLDDRTIEILQSEGAGAETVSQLLLLRDRSAGMPKPPKPAIEEPAAPDPAAQVQIWNAAHENAANFTDSLPDFICSEVVHRYTDPNDKGAWRLKDTLTLKLTYFDKREEYKLMTVNNRSTSLSYEQMGGAITEGEFGSMLAAVFALKSRTNRTWDHWTILRSRPTHVFAFSIAVANSDYGITAGSSREEDRVKAGQRGYVYIDDATRMVVRVTASADGLPPDFPVRQVEMLLDYDFIEIGGKPYLLPVHSETTMVAPPIANRNETDFLAYRKFSADTSVTFDGIKK